MPSSHDEIVSDGETSGPGWYELLSVLDSGQVDALGDRPRHQTQDYSIGELILGIMINQAIFLEVDLGSDEAAEFLFKRGDILGEVPPSAGVLDEVFFKSNRTDAVAQISARSS